MATIICPKCAGTGIITRFLDFHGGECFDCKGTGTLTIAPPAKGRRARSVLVRWDDLAVGLVVRPSTAREGAETITSVGPHPEIGPALRVVTTDAGNTYNCRIGVQTGLIYSA